MLCRKFVIALTCLVAATVHGQDASPKINLTSVAMPVDRCLAEVAKQAGMRLEVVPAMASDVVILRLKDATFDEFKNRLATALAAKWEDVEGGLRLVPDTAARRLESQKEFADYSAALGKALSQLVQSLNPPKTDPKAKPANAQATEMAAQFGFGASNSAAGKAIIRLAQGLGANTLAGITEDSRVVFSSNPTRMQRPMPNNANAILTQLVQEYNVEAARRRKAKAEKPEPEESEQIKKLREFFGNFEDDDKEIDGTPTKALLICTRQALFGGVNLSLRVYNERGQVVVSGAQTILADTNFMGDLGMTFDAQGNPKPKEPAQIPAGEKAIEFSADTKDYQNSTNFMMMAQGAGKLSESLRAKLLHPEFYDPLSFTHSEALIQVAEQRNKNLIAVLPDGMESLMGMATGKQTAVGPTAYLKSIEAKATAATDGNWILVRPVKPDSARKERFDRIALGVFVRAADKKGNFGLDDLATYAMKSRPPMEDAGSLPYIMLFAPNAIQNGMSGTVNWDMLKFYGSLSTNQRRNLVDGSRLGFNQLTPAQLSYVRQMAFGPEQALAVDDPNAKKPDFEMPAIFKRIFQQAAGGDYRSEPTEVMPNGLPPEGFVELKLTVETIAKATGNVPAMFGNAVIGADEMAMLKMFRESESMAQFAAMMPTIDEVKLGKRSIYDFKFTVAPRVTMSHSLNDDFIDPAAPVTKTANLPADFQKAINDRTAMMKKIPFFDPAFFGGRQVIPPLP